MATDVKISSMLQALQVYRSNPAMMIKTFFNALEKAADIKIVDATSPVAWLTEQSVLTTVTAIDGYNSVLRKISPELATSLEDLYPHLNQKDLSSTNSQPSSCTIYLIISKPEVISQMKPIGNTGKKKLTIPANTEFKVSNYVLCMQYPIDITLYPTGALSIQYNNPEISAISSITTNDIAWESFRATDKVEYLKIPISVWQLNVISKEISISYSAGTKSDILLSQNHCITRAFNYTDSAGTWSELPTTGSLYHYDPINATVIVQNLGAKVRVSVPINYITNSQVGSKIRVLTYETAGDITPSLSAFRPNEWSYNWKTLSPNGFTTYESGISGLKTIIIYSDDILSGGSNALDFSTIRKQVIGRSLGTIDSAITQSQLSTALAKIGFDLIKNVDTITNRVYHAVRRMPAPTNDNVTTTASASIVLISTTITQANQSHGVYSQGPGMTTLSSNALYNIVDNVYTLISPEEYDFLLSLSKNNLANYLKNNKYSFSPFDYVITTSTKVPSVKPYYLDKPKISTKTFIDANENASYTVSTSSSYSVTRTATGYDIDLYTNSSDEFVDLNDDDIDVSLLFYSPGRDNKNYIHATLVSRTGTGERHYRASVATNFYIDPITNELYVNNIISDGDTVTTTCSLTTIFSIIYSVKGSNKPNNSNFEDLIDRNTLGMAYVGLTHEQIKLTFGYTLENLWVRYRSSANDRQYLRYQNNIYETHPQNVYKLIDGLPFTITGGQLTWNEILHNAGDYVFTAGGVKVLKHAAGEIITDSMGQPQVDPNYSAELIRHIGIFMLDGVYRFTNDDETLDYLQYVIDTIINWVNDDIAEINNFVLEETQVYFHPKNEHGVISALEPSGKTVAVSAQQRFTVNLYVLQSVYMDSDLKKLIKSKVAKTIKDSLLTNTPSINTIIQNIRNEIGTNIIDVDMSGIDDKYPVVTIINESDRISLNKKIVALSDGTTVVRDDIDIIFTIFDANKK